VQIIQYEEERAATARGDRAYESRDGIEQTQPLLLRRYAWPGLRLTQSHGHFS